MSLKAFHLLFIVLSIVMSAFLAAWAVQHYQADHRLVNLLTALVGTLSAASLAFYAAAFRRKARRL
jgi:DNA-binding transcriptional regulator of glucitol operon